MTEAKNEMTKIKESYIAIGIFCLVLAIYSYTTSSFVDGGDSGELTLVAWERGVAHPPGYPLYTLLSILFAQLPLGTVAFRVSLLSGLCQSGAIVLLFLWVRRWSGSLWAGIGSALYYAFSPSVWQYATVAEVFGLHQLILTAILYFLYRFWITRQTELLLIIALLLGLGVSNHHSIILIGIPITVFLFLQSQVRTFLGSWKNGLYLLLCFGVGLLPYLYLPWASSQVPWNSWGDLTTLDGFITHFFRKEYGTFSLSAGVPEGSGDLYIRLGYYLDSLFQQFGWLGIIFPLIGIVVLVTNRANGGFGVFLCGSYIFYLLMFLPLSQINLEEFISKEVLARFWLQPHLYLFAFFGVGIAKCEELLKRQHLQKKWNSNNIPAFMLGILSAFIVYQFSIHYPERRHFKDSTVLRDYGISVLNGLPKEAVVLSRGDYIVHTLRYLQAVENIRPDVKAIDYSMLSYTWMSRNLGKHFTQFKLPEVGLRPALYHPAGFNLSDLVESNQDRFSIYAAGGFKKWDQSIQQHLVLNVGLVERIIPKNQGVNRAKWAEENRAIFLKYPTQNFAGIKEGTWEDAVQREFWEEFRAFASQLLILSSRDPLQARFKHIPTQEEAQFFEEGVAYLEKIAAESQCRDPDLFKNLTLGYQSLAELKPEKKDYYLQKKSEAWSQYLTVFRKNSHFGLPDR